MEKIKTLKKIHYEYLILLVIGSFISSCNTTKYIPEGEYLLDKVTLQFQDEGVSESDLLPYIQQQPNSAASVGIYNLAGNGSNFFRRTIRKLGAPAIIHKQNKVELSIEELTAQMHNLGYLNSEVTAKVDTVSAKKKAKVTYQIYNGEPYRVRHFTNSISLPRTRDERNSGGFRNLIRNRGETPDSTAERTYSNFLQRRSLIKEGTVFDMNILESEINRVSSILRNQGYYIFTPDNLHYLADTTLTSNQVDLTMTISDSTQLIPYRINKVNVFSGFDPADRDAYHITDSVVREDITIYYDAQHYLRPRVIARKVLLKPGNLFRERMGESTVNLLQSLSGMGMVDLQYEEINSADTALLDCNIFLTPGNNHSVQVGVEGTNKAGDLGVALDLTYGNLNIFNGGEVFNIHTRASYEFVRSRGNDSINNSFYEIGITPSFTFPKLHLPFVNTWLANRFTSQTIYSFGYNIQRRPEFARNFFNFNWKLNWTSQRNVLTQNLSILDINYVNMSWISESFQNYLKTLDPLTRYSYENVFTAGIAYNLTYTGASRGRARYNPYTFRFSAESSGNMLSRLFSIFKANKSATGQYHILGNPFAQYVKGNIDFSRLISLGSTDKLAFRAGIGVAYPYKNSSILPFEKRYFAGGPNNVRGWGTRFLGPGSFDESDGNPALQVGDINFILNLEYRYKLLSWFEPAFFVDAGNIWTIRSYESQPGGLFEWNKFYKEIAVATGIGLRFDLSFLIVRLDAGTRIYDPARAEGNRFVLFKGKLLRNSALHFAIGYPF
ncbi:MAG: BamA/TamA family outer membrane protein [Dysgonamonadaceae bacterium]|jgi:outer membrane protein assembly factor BamA|nr:BamA/TamA family outer membrane protein [Dysgonamonadaceae bacterium]